MEGRLTKEFLASVRGSIEAAKKLGCDSMVVHVQAVPNAAESKRAECMDPRRPEKVEQLVGALRQAAPIAEDAGIVMLLEPLNTIVDHAGCFLERAEQAAYVIREVSSHSLKLLFDIYHMQLSEGNLIANIRQNIDVIGYLHIADVPGRHEPGTGEINYDNILNATLLAGYSGFVGFEYIPSVDPVKSIVSVAKMVERVNNGMVFKDNQ